MTVTLNPETAREHRIARSLGAGGWTVLAELEKALCFNNGPGVLIGKDGHNRWVKPHQIKQEN